MFTDPRNIMSDHHYWWSPRVVCLPFSSPFYPQTDPQGLIVPRDVCLIGNDQFGHDLIDCWSLIRQMSMITLAFEVLLFVFGTSAALALPIRWTPVCFRSTRMTMEDPQRGNVTKLTGPVFMDQPVQVTMPFLGSNIWWHTKHTENFQKFWPRKPQKQQTYLFAKLNIFPVIQSFVTLKLGLSLNAKARIGPGRNSLGHIETLEHLLPPLSLALLFSPPITRSPSCSCSSCSRSVCSAIRPCFGAFASRNCSCRTTGSARRCACCTRCACCWWPTCCTPSIWPPGDDDLWDSIESIDSRLETVSTRTAQYDAIWKGSEALLYLKIFWHFYPKNHAHRRTIFPPRIGVETQNSRELSIILYWLCSDTWS